VRYEFVFRSEQMKSLGVRQAKAHLSALVRAAATGECSLVTDNGRLVAMIGPPPEAPAEAEDPSPAPTEEANATSDAAEFRKALFGVPSPIELNF
jgi:antitoxin (DNA-binding transcriptional repressor) of toxin-antitoxin stability system